MTIAVIGVGAWGKHHVRNFAELGALSAVCSDDITAPTWQNHPVLPFETILKTPHIKGVVIATPTPSHYTMVTQALEAGKHVFVEKPITQSAQEADALVTLAQQKGLTLMVGHLIRYHPCFQMLLDLVIKGHIGQVSDLTFRRTNFGKFRDYESAFRDIAPHDISMLLALLDVLPKANPGSASPALNDMTWSVHKTNVQLSPNSLADQVLLTFTTQTPTLAGSLFFSRIWPTKEQVLILQGTAGCLVFDDTKPWEEKLMLGKYDSPLAPDSLSTNAHSISDPFRLDLTPVAVPFKEPLKEECAHFLSCTASPAPKETGNNATFDGSCLTPGKDAAAILRWMDILGL